MDGENSNICGKRIREKRKELRLTQFELAEEIGTDANAISRWERGEINPGMIYLRKIAQALKTSVAFLLGEIAKDFEEPNQSKPIRPSKKNTPLDIGPIATMIDEIKARAEFTMHEDRVLIAGILKRGLEALEAAEEQRPEKPALDGDVT